MTTRRIAAALATAIAALTLTACGSAPSEASCKAAATKMLVEVFAQVAAGATSIMRRAVACEGVSDDEIYMIATSR